MNEPPYGVHLDGLDPFACLTDTPARLAGIVRGWPAAAFERSHAPGKWTARQNLAHLAHAEMVFAVRLRFALAEDGYVVRPFDQDLWMTAEPDVEPIVALEAYLALRRMTLALCRGMNDAQRRRTCEHPEFGAISVMWLVRFFAGHERSHLAQFEAIDAALRS